MHQMEGGSVSLTKALMRTTVMTVVHRQEPEEQEQEPVEGGVLCGKGFFVLQLSREEEE